MSEKQRQPPSRACVVEMLPGSSELKGALAQVPGPAAYKPEKFQAGERVKHRFTTDFEAAAKSYRLESGFVTGVDEEAKADPSAAASAESEKKKAEDKSGKALAASAGDKQEFRAEVEARVRKDLQARLVVLTKDGGQVPGRTGNGGGGEHAHKGASEEDGLRVPRVLRP